MRLHAIAAGAAVLLCAAVVSCSQEEESPPEAAEPPAGADVEAEENGEGDQDDGEEEAEGEDGDPAPDGGDGQAEEALGWASHPLAGTEDGNGEGFPGVTGGADGDTVTATDGDELAEHLAADEPLTVEVSGEIDLDGSTVPVESNKTLRGVDGAELAGGLVMDGVSNVIVANVHVETGNTAVDVRGGAHHVWVDGSTFVGGQDGSLVSVHGGADHVTLSWNHFLEAESVLAIGGEDEEPGALHVTVHHNYFDGTAARHPRARYAEHVHVFNNYFRANTEYGVQSAFESDVLVEGNYFADTEFSVAFEEEDPGNVAARDNLLVDSEQPELRGEVPEPPYDYEMDDAAHVPDTVPEGAGAQ